jgi:hypothetical protein
VIARAVLGAIAALLATALIAAPAAADGGPVTVTSDVDRTTMTIGDHVLFTITVDLAKGYDLIDPGVPRTIGGFEVVDTLTALQTRMTSGASRIQLRYLLTTFSLGQKALPIVVVGYRGPNGATGEAAAPSGHVIVVQSVVVPGEDTSDIKPLKPPMTIPGAEGDLVRRALPVAGATLVILAAAVLALRVARMRPAPIAGLGSPGAARQALDELERVAGLRLVEQGRVRDHYDLVSAALRRFVGQRYGLHAEARTARELRGDLERAGVGRAHAQILCEALAEAESVRYEERVIYPARATKSMADLIDVMRRSVVAEEYELVGSGASA